MGTILIVFGMTQLGVKPTTSQSLGLALYLKITEVALWSRP